MRRSHRLHDTGTGRRFLSNCDRQGARQSHAQRSRTGGPCPSHGQHANTRTGVGALAWPAKRGGSGGGTRFGHDGTYCKHIDVRVRAANPGNDIAVTMPGRDRTLFVRRLRGMVPLASTTLDTPWATAHGGGVSMKSASVKSLLDPSGDGPLTAVDWWIDRNVLNAEATNDYAAANLGQLMWITTQAFNECEAELPGGAGAAFSNVVSSFAGSNDFVAVNVGQAKCVATSLYDRLIYLRCNQWLSVDHQHNRG